MAKENRKKLKVAKFLGYATLGSSSAYFITKKILKKKSNDFAKLNDGTEENMVGYNSVSPVFNKTVRNNNFVILHVNKNTNVSLIKDRIEYCQKNDISLGLVIDTSAVKGASLYKDFDFVQSIINQYNVDFPVYLNINSIMESPYLNSAQRKVFINSILQKAKSSNMYIALYGTDKNLTNCKNYVMDISEYDCYLVQDSLNISYSGTYTVKEDLDGKITSKYNLAEVINSKNLNKAENLKVSKSYTVKEGDSFYSIALSYNLSEQELREYNNKKSDLKVGDIILIPSAYKKINASVDTSYELDYATLRGIDISRYQSTINWDKVLENFSYVIVGVSQDHINYTTRKGTYVDTAISQIKSTVEQELGLGLYFCISRDMGVDTYKERMERYLTNLDADLISHNVILDRNEVPMFLDFESYYSLNDYYNLMKAFEEVCNRHGFTKIGIYGNKSTLKNISLQMRETNNVSLKDTNWYVWEAGGEYYIPASEERTHVGYKLSEIKEKDVEDNSEYMADIVQVTNACNDSGAPTGYGKCDINYYYLNSGKEALFNSDYYTMENQSLKVVEFNTNKFSHISIDMVFNVLFALGFTVVGVIELTTRGIYRISVKNKTKETEDGPKKRKIN